MMRADLIERNLSIARAVLEGGSYSFVGRESGLHRERVRQITKVMCRLASAKYDALADMYASAISVDVAWMRAHKAEIFAAMAAMRLDEWRQDTRRRG